MLFTWIPLNLPRVPDKFIERTVSMAQQASNKQVENTAVNQGDPAYTNRKLLKDGKEINSRIQYGYKLGDDWEQWVRENIYSDFINTGGRLSVGTDTTTHGAHADSQHHGTPVYKLYYLIDSGGASTLFFKEHGQPIVRVGTTDNICRCDDYSKLEVIDRVQFPAGQWVLLNTNILHGVEDVTGSRINLAVILATHDITSVVQKLIQQ